MFEILQIVNYVILFAVLLLSLYLAISFGKGMLNVFFTSLFFGVLFFAAYLGFSYMQDVGIYALTDTTFHLWAHIIVYLSLGSIMWGGYRLMSIVQAGNEGGLSKKDAYFYAALLILLLLVFFNATPLETVLATHPATIAIGLLGLHHFVVVIMAVIVFSYLKYIRGNWGLLSTSVSFTMGFVVLVGVQHLWENLTESWGVISLSTSMTEGVETMILFPALILLFVGQWKLYKTIKG